MITVLVTGSNGQLGSCIKDVERKYDNLNFIYTDYLVLDICDLNQVEAFFKSNSQIDYCINCAAYTAVDKAETEVDKAFEINVIGAKNLALACISHNAVLIHISTDFVFDGLKTQPYNETDETNPISIYGVTKLKGETEIKQILKNFFIIRTSWLYSERGNNFMKTMLHLSETRSEISVVSDQIGTPTYAGDLAEVILKIVNSNYKNFGVYHYSNQGVASWYDFAKAIFDLSKRTIKIKPISSDAYQTRAKRPVYSVLNKTKIKSDLDITIPYWKDSLRKTLSNL